MAPVGHHGQHVRLVPFFVEQDKVRALLQCTQRVATRDDALQLAQNSVRAAALLETDADAFALDVEDRINEVNCQVPALWREVQRVLGADGEVELRLQRVEEEIDLVHDENAGRKHLHDPH